MDFLEASILIFSSLKQQIFQVGKVSHLGFLDLPVSRKSNLYPVGGYTFTLRTFNKSHVRK